MRRGLVSLAPALVLWATTGAAALPAVEFDGRPYVALEHVARALGTRADTTPSSVRAHLRLPGYVITLTRNWRQVQVNGERRVLGDPVRVHQGGWLVPREFVDGVLPALGLRLPRDAGRAVPVSTQHARALTGTGAALDDLRYRSYPSFTRVVLETSEPVAHRIEPAGPRATRIRILGMQTEPRTEEIRDGLVGEVRLERAGPDTLVHVLFEATPGEVRTTTLADPPRLVLDFRRPVDPAARERVQAAPLRVIVLDPGHGGHDSGAVGPSGLMEKDLVLDVAQRVARLVEEHLGVRVLLTRDGDYFVPLRERTSFANKHRADLFVSIHANAHRQSDSAGVETYFLSSEATDGEARRVAALENSVVELERPTPRGRPDIVKAILWDLAQSEFQIESSRLAEIVQDSMTRALRIPNRGVKQAGFYVLGGAAMPAILVEIGFVTNPREERRLREPRFRDEIARAIYAGLAEYKRHWDQRVRAAADRSP
jgi:N-acetylmuramoyl-L-alanine amidase